MKTAVWVLFRLFINSNERCNTKLASLSNVDFFNDQCGPNSVVNENLLYYIIREVTCTNMTANQWSYLGFQFKKKTVRVIDR